MTGFLQSHPPFLIPAILILIFCVPLVLRLVPPNRFYGIRTKKTLSDKEIWYRVNARGGLGLMVSSLSYLVTMHLVAYDARNLSTVFAHMALFIGPMLVLLLIYKIAN